jgi:hypothetical protein
MWWTENSGPNAPDDVRLTQWDVVVRTFQVVARMLISGSYAYPALAFPSDGNCDSLPSVVLSGVRSDADEIVPNGQWDDRTARALGTLLCRAQQKDAAVALSGDIRSHTFSASTVKWLVLIGLHFRLPASEMYTSPLRTDIPFSAVTLPDDFVLPLWDLSIASAPADAFWVGKYQPASGTPPLAPSQLAQNSAGGTNTTGTSGASSATIAPAPWYQSEFGRYLVAGGASLALAGGLYYGIRMYQRKGR